MNRHENPPPFDKLPITKYLESYLLERGYELQTSVLPHAKFIKRFARTDNNLQKISVILHIDINRHIFDVWEYYDTIGDNHKIDVTLTVDVDNSHFSTSLFTDVCHQSVFQMAPIIYKMILGFEDFISGESWFDVTADGFIPKASRPIFLFE